MNKIMDLYNEYLNDLKVDLEKTMIRIKTIQQQSVVLDDESNKLMIKLMKHYCYLNTNINITNCEIDIYVNRLSKENKA